MYIILDLVDKQKGLAPVLIIILVSLVVGGYLLYQKQTKPVVSQLVAQFSPSPVTSSVAASSSKTAGWKTYTNKIDGYSLKYPNNFIVSESFVGNGNIHTTTISNYKKNDIKDPDDDNIFLMFILSHPEEPKLKAKSLYEPQNILEDYTVGGVTGFKVGQDKFGTIVVVYKKTEYQFELRPYNSKYGNNFFQILSTFKFI